MKPLITIETVPISVKYVEKKEQHTSAQSAKMHFTQQNDTLTIKSNAIHIPVHDSYQPSAGSESPNLSYTATARYLKDGKLNMDVQMENSSEYAFQRFPRTIDSLVDSLPVQYSGSEIDNMQISFDISQLSGGLTDMSNFDTSFLPPDLELEVVERPKVIIKYVGGPLYIPKSADPNYKAPEYHDQIFDGKTSLDVKA